MNNTIVYHRRTPKQIIDTTEDRLTIPNQRDLQEWRQNLWRCKTRDTKRVHPIKGTVEEKFEYKKTNIPSVIRCVNTMLLIERSIRTTILYTQILVSSETGNLPLLDLILNSHRSLQFQWVFINPYTCKKL